MGGNLLCLELFGALFALELHVVNEHFEDLAALQEVRQNLVGRVGVNMHLELRRAAYAQLAIAHGLQEVESFLGVERLGVDQELVAVLVLGAFPVVDLLDLDLGCRGTGEGELVDHRLCAAGKGGNERIEEDGDAEAASIDHAVFLQHGKKLRRTLNGSICLAHDELQALVKLHLLLAGLMSSSGGIAQNSEDGALNRLANRIERNLYRTSKSIVHRNQIEIFVVGNALAQAAHDLRRDNARVAACAHQGARGDGATTIFAGSTDGKLCQIFHHHGQGKGHVGASITIRNRENVQTVDFIFTSFQCLGCSSNSIDDVVRCVIAHSKVVLL